MPATFAQRLARLRIHGNSHVGVQNFRLGGEGRMRFELGLDAASVAHQQEARVRVTDKGDRRAGDDHAWSMVAAHGVERYGDWSSHMVPLPKGKTLLIPAQAAG